MLYMIVNPIAGGGRALKVAAALEEALRGRGVSWRRADTMRAGHAVQLAREAAERGVEGIVSVGGDGTNYEIVNGVGETGVPLYFASCGTGNDFRKALGLAADPVDAFVSQLDGEAGGVDLFKVNGGYCLNVSGIGFDALVLEQTARFKWLGRGLLPYLAAVFAAIHRYRPLPLRVELDGEALEREVTIMAVANGNYLGGGMKVAPNARPDDGLLDVVIVRAVPRWQIPILLPSFVAGSFVRLPIVSVRRCRRVRVEPVGAAAVTLDLDGELLDVPSVTYQILPGALRVRRPRGQ